MIEKIINEGHYRFIGTVEDLKHYIGGFKITKVITDGQIQGINIFSAFAEFRYRGNRHKLAVTSEFSSEKILILEYRGIKETNHGIKKE